jgi:hypothetical protein
MKKLVCIAAFFFLFTAPMALAQTWYHANEFTCAWDAVTTDADGDPLPADATIEYEVFLANAVTDPDKTSPVSVWRGTELTATIALNTKGQYYVGVKSILVFLDGTELVSDFNWSDVLDARNGEEWAVRHHAPPLKPGNFRKYEQILMADKPQLYKEYKWCESLAGTEPQLCALQTQLSAIKTQTEAIKADVDAPYNATTDRTRWQRTPFPCEHGKHPD